MKRRTFLQLSGMTAASGALAGCQKGNEKLIPFLVPPEDGATPGIADWYASSCSQCPAGCGIVVKVSEGRAHKIEGNPRHPVNRGKLCARGQAALQELYHPDRLRAPLKRSGPRGSGQFSPIGWDEALAILADRLTTISAEGAGRRAILWTPPLHGYLADLAARFGQGFGRLSHLAWEPLAPAWRRGSLYGHEARIDYDLENTQYLVSFGADFIETHLSPVRFGNAFGRMRQERPTVRGRFTYIGPRLSLTAASADRWLPARPGTEWTIALAMARRLLPGIEARTLSAAGLDRAELARLVEPYSVSAVAEMTGVGAADIESAVTELAAIRPALAIGGEMLTAQGNGPAALRAVELLNLLLGSVNTPGGVYLTRREENSLESSPSEMTEALAAMQAGSCEVLLLHGVNPAYNLPPGFGFARALEKVPLVVSCGTLLDDTARLADLVLPAPANLESWGEMIPAAGTRGRIVGLMQPVVQPLYDTRSFPDLLLALAHHPGGGAGSALPEESFLDGLRKRHAPGNPAAWNEMLALGGIFPPQTAANERPRKRPLERPDSPAPAGNDPSFPLLLQVYPSPAFYDGRGAALPWLQQLPDPMTTAVWGSWLEINPQTAARLGISHGDLVEVASPAGSIRLPAVIYPGIRPEVVAAPLGQGHQGLGRYADGRGVNPLRLSSQPETDGGIPFLATIPVQVRGLAQDGELVTAGHSEGSYRRELLGI